MISQLAPLHKRHRSASMQTVQTYMTDYLGTDTAQQGLSIQMLLFKCHRKICSWPPVSPHPEK